MTTTRIIAAAVLIVGSGLALHVARAQQPGLNRADLQRHDLSVPGREVVQVLVEFAPGVVAARHSHPGEEIVYVVEGSLEYRLDGRPLWHRLEGDEGANVGSPHPHPRSHFRLGGATPPFGPGSCEPVSAFMNSTMFGTSSASPTPAPNRMVPFRTSESSSPATAVTVPWARSS